jgi:hypothetical protein
LKDVLCCLIVCVLALFASPARANVAPATPTTQAEVDALLALVGAPAEQSVSLMVEDCYCNWFRRIRGLQEMRQYYLELITCVNPAAEANRQACIEQWFDENLCEIVDWYMECTYGECWTEDGVLNPNCYTQFGYPLPWYGCDGSHAEGVCDDIACFFALTPGWEVIGGGYLPSGCNTTLIYPAWSPDCPCVNVD